MTRVAKVSVHLLALLLLLAALAPPTAAGDDAPEHDESEDDTGDGDSEEPVGFGAVSRLPPPHKQKVGDCASVNLRNTNPNALDPEVRWGPSIEQWVVLDLGVGHVYVSVTSCSGMAVEMGGVLGAISLDPDQQRSSPTPDVLP